MDDLEITPAETKQRLDRGEKLLLVDVREPWESEICRIEGANSPDAPFSAPSARDKLICKE